MRNSHLGCGEGIGIGCDAPCVIAEGRSISSDCRSDEQSELEFESPSPESQSLHVSSPSLMLTRLGAHMAISDSDGDGGKAGRNGEELYVAPR